ncbi:MAG TPA: carboxymuconolactone decarboxylase family protein [Candidatus Cybelea sp.]|nr:carboxymuconolactone decarboxylase family protein [Candidatus Cybelea sp.]
MRLAKPRVATLPQAEWDEDAHAVLDPIAKNGMLFNIFLTLARHAKALKRWTVFANHVLYKSTLPPREREILILRIGWLCQAEYEWGQHVRIGRQAGLTDAEIDRIAKGPDAPGWGEFDRALLRAADELHKDAFISDATWAALGKRYNTQQLIDVVFTVGNYNLVSMMLNTLGVQLDESVEGFKRK